MHPDAYMGPSYADTTEKADQQHVLEQFDQEIDRLAMNLDNLQKRLDPLTTRYATSEVRAGDPRPEPASALRGRVERLRDLVDRLNQITSDLDF